MHAHAKILMNKRRARPQIDVMFKEDDTILGSPRLALFAINNFLLKVNYRRIHYVVCEELLYLIKLAN
jgi:hypothetical protein